MDGLDLNVVETHTAVLFFVGDHVYKLKKAVDLGFLDHRDRQARQATCQREVELNRRLAPDVYLGVIDLVDEAGELVDHLVDMRRLPEDRRLTRCLERGDDVEPALRRVAHAVAALHRAGASSPRHDRAATVGAVAQRWADGFDQLRGLGVAGDLADALDRTEALARRYLAGRGPLFEQRIADGWIRDGHGDLQAEDVFVLDDGPRVLDCLEFDEGLRWGDVLADVGFLAMDLERLGRADLAAAFLAWHRELCADRWPATLADHYVAYRAHVRAKVGIVRAAQRSEPVDAGVEAHLDLSLAHLQAAQVRVVLVGGAPGTGKSTVAEALGDRLGAVVLRTDEVRQRLGAGHDAADRYRPEAVDATYAELVREAHRLVGLGEHVVLDATWGTQRHRDLARQVAIDGSCELVELRCTLAPAVAAERIRARQAAGTDPSEATVAVAEQLAARFERWPEAFEVPTSGPRASAAELAWSQLAAADPPLVGARRLPAAG